VVPSSDQGAGEAQRIKSLAEAEAEKAARIGIAQAVAIEEQVRASGGPQLQLTPQVLELSQPIAGPLSLNID
jgi:hypothetical protein